MNTLKNYLATKRNLAVKPAILFIRFVTSIALAFLLTNVVFAQELKVIKYPELAKIIEGNPNEKSVKIINFWATWCKPCIKELPQFEALNKKYKNQGLEVILVNVNEVGDLDPTVIAFINKKQLLSTLYLWDEPDFKSKIEKIDPNWAGGIPATLMINFRTNQRVFRENEFKKRELEKAYLNFIK